MPATIHAVEPYSDSKSRPVKIIKSSDQIRENFHDYLTDESRISGGECDEIIFVFSEKQVADTVCCAYQIKKPITVSAGRTGITGGAIPFSGTLLCMEKMDRILGVRWDENLSCWCMRLEPGIILERLQKILDNKDFYQTQENISDDVKDVFQKFIDESDQWFYPPDPTEKTAHIGGTVATNASGSRSFKYGPTRNFITKLRVVLSTGSVLEIPRGWYIVPLGECFVIYTPHGTLQVDLNPYYFAKLKNTSGYFQSDPMDLIDLFIGSEGTLGVITEIEVALAKKPEMILGVVAYFQNSEDGFHFVSLVKNASAKTGSGIDPSVLEYFDKHSLDLLKGKRQEPGNHIPTFPDSAQAAIYFEQACEESQIDKIYSTYEEYLTQCGTSMDDTWGAMEPAELRKMMLFRHAVPEAVNNIIGQRKKDYPELHKVGTDFVVPDERFHDVIQICKSLLDNDTMHYVIFGHIGENHLHINMIPRDNQELRKAKNFQLVFAKLAVQAGGTVSGEHGIGKMKKELLKIMYSNDDLSKMKQIKHALDPLGILGQETLF